ncbi:MAG: hypothetical protein KAR42_06905 [candidate division Zixibacteria bacterium]|nr:hypothetical protein [candidate division Zixibacteria bacterium]
MKKYIILLLVCLLAIPALAMARKKYNTSYHKARQHYSHTLNHYQLDDARMIIEDESIIIYSQYFDEEVEITEDYKLFIDGKLVATDKKQTAVLKKFYAQALEVKEIGEKMGELGGDMGQIGGKMGQIGSLIGLRASRQAYLSLAASFSGNYYDDNELEDNLEELEDKLDAMEDKLDENEDDMDELSDKMENLGEVMEEYGDEMEDEVDELEEVFEDMLEEIPELDELDW